MAVYSVWTSLADPLGDRPGETRAHFFIEHICGVSSLHGGLSLVPGEYPQLDTSSSKVWRFVSGPSSCNLSSIAVAPTIWIFVSILAAAAVSLESRFLRDDAAAADSASQSEHSSSDSTRTPKH
jgi:hypothetical protein